MRRLRLPILIILLACLAGCASHKRTQSLSQTLMDYGAALRWNGFQQGLGYVSPTYREAHPLSPLDIARYRQVRVASYDPGDGPTPVSADEVRQVVKIGLINRHTQAERFIVTHEVWKWDANAGRWWLMTGLPDVTHATNASP